MKTIVVKTSQSFIHQGIGSVKEKQDVSSICIQKSQSFIHQGIGSVTQNH